MDIPSLCAYLPWDSEFFGLRIGRLNGERLTAGITAAALDWCATEKIDCLYFLAGLEETETLALAAKTGFRLVDVRVTLKQTAGAKAETKSAPAEGIRTAIERDIPPLREVAAGLFGETRFSADPGFGQEAAERLYQVWIENSIRGYAEQVFTAEVGGVPAGFVTCHLTGEQGRIGLFGVGTAAQGHGLGRRLLEAAKIWFTEQGAGSIRVATQGRNRAALAVYQHSGFMVEHIGLWYHLWGGKSGTFGQTK